MTMTNGALKCSFFGIGDKKTFSWKILTDLCVNDLYIYILQ
jgi:hypothetical protein